MQRSLAIALVSAVCLLVPIGSTLAQVSIDQRHAEKAVEVAKMVYDKLSSARQANPEAVSADDVTRASLYWFKVAVTAAESKSEAMKAAAEFLEREGSPRP